MITMSLIYILLLLLYVLFDSSWNCRSADPIHDSRPDDNPAYRILSMCCRCLRTVLVVLYRYGGLWFVINCYLNLYRLPFIISYLLSTYCNKSCLKVELL